jgi:thiosulfate reductase cytochrome b subunit
VLVLAGLAGLAVHGLLYGLTRRKRLPPADSGLAAQNRFPPLAVRWWHALNAATVLLLLATGFLLRFFAAGGAVWARPARMLHGGAGLLLTSIWLFWLMYSALRRRVLCRDGALCRPDPVRGIRRQLGYYAWGVFHGHADPHARTARDPLNPLQKLVYLVVMGALMPLIIMTGLALLKMFRMFAGGWTLAVLDGHMISGCLLLLFLCMHLYLAAWGPSARPRLRPGRAEGGD